MRSTLISILLVVALGSFGCQEEGPGERLGKQVDEAVDKLQHGDEGALEKAGRKVDEAVDDAVEAVEDVVDDAGEAIEDLGEDLQGE